VLALPAASAQPSRVGIGINYYWWRTWLLSPADCRAEQTARTFGSWFLPHYQRSDVRAAVRSQLRAMHASGFTSLRVPVFFYRDSAPVTDSFTSLDGTVSAADRTKLAHFVGDVRAAGFKTLELVPTFQDKNDIYCRNHQWGDCFVPARTVENERFIDGVAQTAIAAAGGMQLRFDLGNEQAPDPRMPAVTLAQAKRYLQTIAGNFQRRFGSNWLISAARSGRSQAWETRDRLDLLVADLAQAGLHPKYLEIHNYTGDGNDLYQSLNMAQRIAQRIGAKIVLGELRYHSTVEADAIAAWLHRHPDSRVVDVMQWPEYNPNILCNIDPTPPYTPGQLGKLPAKI
jgi:hypothetical protein